MGAMEAIGTQEPMQYAELQVTTNFSFLRGASHAWELVEQAAALGLSAIAVTDRNTLAGVVRAHIAAKQWGVKLIVGARLDLEDAPSLLCLPRDRAAYGRLSRLLSLGQGRAEKGKCTLFLDDVAQHAEGQIFIALPPDDWDWRSVREPIASDEVVGVVQRSAEVIPFRPLQGDAASAPILHAHQPADSAADIACGTSEIRSFEDELRRMKAVLGGAGQLYLAARYTYRGDDRARIETLAALAQRCATPLVATGDVLYHTPERRPLQDVLTCVREKTTIRRAGLRLEANAERHLKSPAEMAR
ncbi:MAG TPA: PHP domain-containing protein, partial [Hyphomicrobium sp.]|nr:PHP domain-containing protein [Hyphomicrobium sp.]